MGWLDEWLGVAPVHTAQQKLGPQREDALNGAPDLRTSRAELERAGIDPQGMAGYEAIEKYARARMAETMKPPQLSTGELIGGALQNIGGVVAYAQGNPQFGQHALSNNYLTQHAKAAQDHKSQMSKLSGDLALNTVSNFDKYYTGNLEERRKLKLQARQQIMALEAEKLPVPPHLYDAAGLKPSTAPIHAPPQAPQGPAGPTAAPPSGAPPVAPSGPLPQVPGMSVAPPDPGNMALPPGMPPMETGAAPATAPQGAAPTAAPPSPQMTRLEAARNNPAAMEAFQKARVAHITGNKELGDAHMERFKQLSSLSSEEAEVLRGMDDPEFEKSRLKGKRAGSSAAEPAYDAEIGKMLAKQLQEINEKGGAAAEAKGDLLVMQHAIQNPDVYMGTGGDLVQALKKGGATVFGMDLKGVPDGEVIQRTAAKIALGMKDGLPGPMSDSDRQFLLSLPPGLETTPDGAARLVDLGLAQREWKISIAEAANAYVKENGRLDQGWFAVKAALDQRAADKMGNLARELQARQPVPNRSPTAGTGPRVSTQAEYDALPRGTVYEYEPGKFKQKR